MYEQMKLLISLKWGRDEDVKLSPVTADRFNTFLFFMSWTRLSFIF
jgi:hypothetical protein